MHLLKVKNLHKSFRSQWTFKKHEVLKGISFELEAGKITGFLGANGAGKTTTIKCLLGLIFPDSGEIDFFGKGYNTAEIKSRIGFLPERPYFYDYLTGYEILKFAAQLSGVDRSHKQIDELLERVNLLPAKNKRLREYSKGMLQRVGIAQALIHNPDFVILDEPMSGLDPDGRHLINTILKETAARGTTLFFSSHLLNDAESICQNLVILTHGNVAYTGGMSSLLEKVQSGFEIQYRESSSIKSKSVNSEVELQKSIDELRQKGFAIYEIRPIRPSLEKAFVDISSGRLKIEGAT